MQQTGVKALSFEVIASVESTTRVTATFPAYLRLYDSNDDGRTSWEFFVRIDLIGTDQARVDFLKIDSDGEYEFRTECLALRRCGQYFRPGNSYDRSSPAEFNAKIAQLRSALDQIPQEV